MNIGSDISSQRGAATLFVAVILLIAVTLLVMFAVRVGILDQRISGNEFRHKEAFSNAEAGLEQAASYLRANPALHEDSAVGWTACDNTTFPCSISDSATMVLKDGATYLPATTLADSTAYLFKTATGTIAAGVGQSNDITGRATVQVEYAKTSLLTPGKIPPLMIPSGTLSGNFNIVPDPNGGGPGVPISVWAKDTLGTSGANWKTCDIGQYKDGTDICMRTKGDGDSGPDWLSCSCDEERSNSGNIGDDIVLYTSGFPDSPFTYVFNAEREDVKARAEATGFLLSDCTNLDALIGDVNRPKEKSLIWVTGDCAIGSNITVGSREKPIILIVDGELRVNAGAEVWGILFGWTDFVLNGGPVIHGSAISEIPSDLTNGTYYQVYDADVFDNLRDDTINTNIAKKSYSWRDF